MKRSASTHTEPPVQYRLMPNGSTYVELKIEERIVSRLSIIRFIIHVGSAKIRMDGIGGVATEPEYRNRGYARRVLQAAIERMTEGDAALSMLYGIRDLYPKFGYATAGPDHLIELLELDGGTSLPPGWKVRPFEVQDLPELQSLYETTVREAVGAAVRETTGRVWSHLMKSAEGKPDCRVAIDPSGKVAGYAWKGTGFWYLGELEKVEKNSLVLSEVMARDVPSAQVVLTLCKKWALEGTKSKASRRLVISAPPEGPVAAAARLQAAQLIKRYPPCGGSMARVLSASRLLEGLAPVFQERLDGAPKRLRTPLKLVTDIGAVSLPITSLALKRDATGKDASASDGKGGDESILTLPQWQLARLALGAFPPDDIINQLEETPSPEVREQVRVLFPYCSPHMYIADRF